MAISLSVLSQNGPFWDKRKNVFVFIYDYIKSAILTFYLKKLGWIDHKDLETKKVAIMLLSI